MIPSQEVTHFLSLYQWIVGKGTPMAWHCRVTSWLMTAERSLEESVPVMVGGTETQRRTTGTKNLELTDPPGKVRFYAYSKSTHFSHV